MSKRRYSAAKRAREINKAEERARKLARKHGKTRRPEGDASGTGTATEPGTVDPATPQLPPATVIDPDPTPRGS